METHRVIHGGGSQTLSTVPYSDQDEPKVVTSATYSIVDLRRGEDDSERTIQASTAATVDSVSTTTTAAAGTGAADKRLIPLTSATGVAEGTHYVIDSGSGLRELVLVDYIDSLNVYARDPLRFAYASGSTFKGVEVSGTFPSAEAADDESLEDGGGPYAIDWVFVGVTPAYKRELVWVVRSDNKYYAAVSDVMMLDQTVANVTRDVVRLEICVAQAHRDFRAALRERGVDMDDYHGGENARDAVTYRAAAIARSHMRSPRDVEIAREYNAIYRGKVANITPAGTVITDKDNDDAPSGSTRKDYPFFEFT